MDGFKCVPSGEKTTTCTILHGNQITYSFWDPNSDFHYFKKTFRWRLSTSRRPDCLTEILPEQLGRYRPRGPLRVFIEAEAFP